MYNRCGMWNLSDGSTCLISESSKGGETQLLNHKFSLKRLAQLSVKFSSKFSSLLLSSCTNETFVGIKETRKPQLKKKKNNKQLE